MKIRPDNRADEADLRKPVYMIPNEWFLHGELADRYDGDKGDIMELTPDEMNTVFKYQENMKPLLGCRNELMKAVGGLWFLEGVYDVEIEWDPRPAVGFFWYIQTSTMLFQRGLVVYADDEEAYRFANTKYQERTWFL